MHTRPSRVYIVIISFIANILHIAPININELEKISIEAFKVFAKAAEENPHREAETGGGMMYWLFGKAAEAGADHVKDNANQLLDNAALHSHANLGAVIHHAGVVGAPHGGAALAAAVTHGLGAGVTAIAGATAGAAAATAAPFILGGLALTVLTYKTCKTANTVWQKMKTYQIQENGDIHVIPAVGEAYAIPASELSKHDVNLKTAEVSVAVEIPDLTGQGGANLYVGDILFKKPDALQKDLVVNCKHFACVLEAILKDVQGDEKTKSALAELLCITYINSLVKTIDSYVKSYHDEDVLDKLPNAGTLFTRLKAEAKGAQSTISRQLVYGQAALFESAAAGEITPPKIPEIDNKLAQEYANAFVAQFIDLMDSTDKIATGKHSGLSDAIMNFYGHILPDANHACTGDTLIRFPGGITNVMRALIDPKGKEIYFFAPGPKYADEHYHDKIVLYEFYVLGQMAQKAGIDKQEASTKLKTILVNTLSTEANADIMVQAFDAGFKSP